MYQIYTIQYKCLSQNKNFITIFTCTCNLIYVRILEEILITKLTLLYS